MSDAPTISITVAAYNVEEFIEHCLHSLLSQRFRDFEVIVVDDASSDATPSIVDGIAALDVRLRRLSHTENAGLAATRQSGLRAARGEFIWQIDGDDYVPNDDVLGDLLSAAQRTGADIVRGRFLIDTKGEITDPKWFLPWSETVLYRWTDVEALYANPFGIWLNFFRASFIQTLPAHPGASIDLGEDVIFNSFAYTMASRIALMTMPIIHYREREGSYTKTDLRRYRFLDEAKAQAICYRNWDGYPEAQTHYAFFKTPYRMKRATEARRILPYDEALAVIDEYKKVYVGWDIDRCYEAALSSGAPPTWRPDRNKRIADFANRMRDDGCAKVYEWLSDRS